MAAATERTLEPRSFDHADAHSLYHRAVAAVVIVGPVVRLALCTAVATCWRRWWWWRWAAAGDVVQSIRAAAMSASGNVDNGLCER